MNDVFFNLAILDSAQQCPLSVKAMERLFGFVLRSQGITLAAWASMRRLIGVNKVSLADLAKPAATPRWSPSGPHDERDVEGAVAALANIRCEPRALSNGRSSASGGTEHNARKFRY